MAALARLVDGGAGRQQLGRVAAINGGQGTASRFLQFDRAQARGFRLNIAAGTAVRFEPGQTRTVELVELAGKRQVYGFRAAIMGKL